MPLAAIIACARPPRCSVPTETAALDRLGNGGASVRASRLGRGRRLVRSLAPPEEAGKLVSVFGVFRGTKAGTESTANHANHANHAKTGTNAHFLGLWHRCVIPSSYSRGPLLAFPGRRFQYFSLSEFNLSPAVKMKTNSSAACPPPSVMRLASASFKWRTGALLVAMLVFSVTASWAQSAPTAQTLPYSQNWGTTTFTTMPAGWAAWLAGGNKTTQSAAETGAPSGDDTVTAATASQNGGGIYGFATSSNGRLYLQESSNTTRGTPTVAFAFNTGNNTVVSVSYDLELINGGVTTQDYGHALQYRAGTTGSFTTISGSAMTFGAVTTYTPATRSFSISGLTANTDYQIRIITWRPNGSGASKGIGIDNFKVSVGPTVTSSAATSIGTTTATLNGNVTSDGGATITERGFVYKTSSGVTIADNKTTVSGTTGSYSLGLSSLGVNVEYFFKAYAINSVNTTLSSELSFWTLANTPSAPTVNGATTSSLDVTINGNGNPASTEFAIHESAGSYVQTDGSLGGSPVWQTATAWGTKTVTGLDAGTTYTFAVKARNGANVETDFGDSASDTTQTSGCTPPTITSTTPGNLTCNGSANGSITVAASGGDGAAALEYSKDNGATWQLGNAFTGLSASTYQIRVKRSDGCVSPATAVTLTQPDAVTITLGSTLSVCFGATSADLPFSATTGTPSTYSIDFDGTANSAGFVNVTDAPLGASLIGISIPANVAAGTYNATLTVKTNTCTSPGYAITVTVNPTSVGGTIAADTATFCGSGTTTLTLSGHTGTVTKWQYSPVSDFSSGVTDVANTTTTLTTPTLTVTRYYRAVVTSGACSSANSAIATLTVNPLPTITLGANLPVCSDAGSANKPYTATTGTPDQYSIDFSAAANAAGFADVTLASLPESQIVITVPNGVAAGTYTGTLTVKNSTTGCESAGTAISVTVNAFALPTTIAAQGFETSGDTWSYTSSGLGGSASTATGSGDTPDHQRILAGSGSWQVNNSGATTPSILTFDGVSVSDYSAITLTVRVSSTSLSTGNGVEPGDHVKVFVALNGGAFSATPDIDLFGADNARWGYTANLIRTTSAGTPVTAQAPQNGTSTNNYSTLRVTIPNGTTSVRLKLEINNDASNEVWNIDGITLSGTPPAVASITPSGATTFCGSGTVTLTATAGGASYLWLPGGETTQAITNNQSSTTTYTVVVTGANGCSSSASQTVTINSPATVSAGEDQLIQAGGTVTLAGTIDGGATSATWSGGTGSFDPNATTVNAVYTPSEAEVAAGTVTLTLTTDDPAGPCPAVNDSVTIAINRPPVANADTFLHLPGFVLKIPLAGLTANDTDADNDPITLTGISPTSANGVTLVTNSTFIFYTNGIPPAADQFSYTIADGQGGTSTGTVTINLQTSVSGQATGIMSPSEGVISISFAGRPGWSYQVQRSLNLSTWDTIWTTNAPANGLFNYTDDFADLEDEVPAAAYYRLLWSAE
jgi:hypothetical protein